MSKCLTLMMVAVLSVVTLVFKAGGAESPAPPRPPHDLGVQVADEQVFQAFTNRIITEACCIPLGETVSSSLGTVPKTVVIVFNTQARGGSFGVGLTVNGGPCLAWGVNIFPSSPGFEDRTTQFVVLSRFLRAGGNSFELCGGRLTEANVELGIRTMAARKGN